MRSPSGDLVDSTATPFFLPKTERKPRMECGCQEVAFSSSCKVAPLGRFTRSRILAVLLPGRALPAFRRGWAPFFADLGLRADLAWEAAARPFFAATVAFWGGLGFPAAVAVAWAGSRFSVVDVVMVVAPLAVITATTTWITQKRSHCKRSLWKFGKGDGMAMRAGKRGTQSTLRDEPESLPRPINRLGPRASTVHGSG